jgi:hypothetical protein
MQITIHNTDDLFWQCHDNIQNFYLGKNLKRQRVVSASLQSTVSLRPVKSIHAPEILFTLCWSFRDSFGDLFNSSWFLLASLLLWEYPQFWVIPLEERFLQERFGQKYVNYCNKTPRWV